MIRERPEPSAQLAVVSCVCRSSHTAKKQSQRTQNATGLVKNDLHKTGVGQPIVAKSNVNVTGFLRLA